MAIGDWVDSAVKIVGGIVGGFWLGYLSRRPNLKIIGSSESHIANKVMTTSAVVKNKPLFLGRVPMDREAATIVKACIYDPDLKQFVEPALRWHQKGVQELTHECTVGSGREATLYLFAKEPYSLEFFIFAPNRLADELPEQRRRSALPKYNDAEKQFFLVLLDVNDRKYRYKFTARNSQQGVSVVFRTSKLRARWDLLRKRA
jgi:hypothetical protein